LNRNSLVCSSCGAIIAIEAFVTGSHARIWRWLSKPDALIWILALIPLFLAPPIFSLFFVYRERRSGGSTRDRTFVILCALCNIILTLLLWKWFGERALAMGSWLQLPWQSNGSSSGVKLLPI
jgi:hypothetical protein